MFEFSLVVMVVVCMCVQTEKHDDEKIMRYLEIEKQNRTC